MAYSDSFSNASYKFQSLSLGSEDASALYCQPCQPDNKHVPAHGYCQTCKEHLCDECYRTHRRPAPLRNHVLLDRSEMPRTQGPGQSSQETCVKHDGEAVKYFCKNHNIPGCCSCVTIDHRNCEIVYINEAARDFETSEEYSNLLESLENIKFTCYKVEEKSAKVLQSREAVGREIQAFRKQINEQIDKWEMALHAENDKFHNEDQQTVTSELSHRELLEHVEQIQENLKRLETTGNNPQLYLEAKKCERTINNLKTKSKKIEKNAKFSPSCHFQKNEGTSFFLSSGNCLGEIVKKKMGSMQQLVRQVYGFK